MLKAFSTWAAGRRALPQSSAPAIFSLAIPSSNPSLPFLWRPQVSCSASYSAVMASFLVRNATAPQHQPANGAGTPSTPSRPTKTRPPRVGGSSAPSHRTSLPDRNRNTRSRADINEPETGQLNGQLAASRPPVSNNRIRATQSPSNPAPNHDKPGTNPTTIRHADPSASTQGRPDATTAVAPRTRTPVRVVTPRPVSIAADTEPGTATVIGRRSDLPGPSSAANSPLSVGPPPQQPGARRPDFCPNPAHHETASEVGRLLEAQAKDARTIEHLEDRVDVLEKNENRFFCDWEEREKWRSQQAEESQTATNPTRG